MTHRGTQTDGRYEVHRSCGLKCHDISTAFYKILFRNSKVNSEDSQTNRQRGDYVSHIIFLQYKEIG